MFKQLYLPICQSYFDKSNSRFQNNFNVSRTRDQRLRSTTWRIFNFKSKFKHYLLFVNFISCNQSSQLTFKNKITILLIYSLLIKHLLIQSILSMILYMKSLYNYNNYLTQIVNSRIKKFVQHCSYQV